MLDQLARDVRDGRCILFVGAGLSKLLGLPTWEELIRHMARELDFDPDVLVGPGADFLQVAEFYKLKKGSMGELRSWMDKNWNVADDAIRFSSVHKQIVELGFPLIYTTNYDNNLERAFQLHGRPFSKIVSVLDISSARTDCPHIVKFHGDFSDDNSLVITETNYFERLEFESPLDLRLRSDALGRSILFVGYSLKDFNLRLLLYKLKRTWEGTAYAKKRPQSYIFLIRPDPVQEVVLESRGISPVVSESLAPDRALPEFFDKLLDMVRQVG
jgi:hypothetical protein